MNELTEKNIMTSLESLEKMVDNIGDRLLRLSLNALVVTMMNVIKLNRRSTSS